MAGAFSFPGHVEEHHVQKPRSRHRGRQSCIHGPGPRPCHPFPAADTAPLKAAFVYLTPVLDAGWTRQHDEGRRALQSALGPRVRTSAVDSVPEGPDAERVLRDLAASGNRLIFTTSFGYTESVMRVARDFPQVRFESVTGFKRADNVATSNARYYEGRYLSGIAAGRASRTGVAGFVVGFPIPEVLQGINAFTLGMRSVNPKATVKVVWLDTWFDPPRELTRPWRCSTAAWTWCPSRSPPRP